MDILSSLLYTIIVGGIFVYVFIFIYDVLYGEKHEKQVRKIQNYFKKDSVGKIELIEHQPKKYSLYQVQVDQEKKRIKVKPGYKVVKMVAKKK